MSKVKVGVAGFGVIGQRLADGVAWQEDMELVGVADVAALILRSQGFAATKERIATERNDNTHDSATQCCHHHGLDGVHPILGLLEDDGCFGEPIRRQGGKIS